MKQLKTLISYTLYTLLFAVFLTGCKERRTTIEKFCGGVVYEKGKTLGEDLYFAIKKENKFKKVYVYELEWNKYKVADTINCN
tara:strand:+ start:8614 stop:8862 length:249 start_codon:yes stop_codon:yes gene_type:complete